MAKILIVDDDRDAGESIAKVLEKAGHEVTYVLNGREALSHILSQVPDVVLLDLAMPEMDGPSFLEVVRSYLRIQSLPVVDRIVRPDKFHGRRTGDPRRVVVAEI